MTRRWSRFVAPTVALGLVSVGCSRVHVAAQPKSPPVGVQQPAGLYVAVGANETRGEGTDNPTRESWPQVLFRTLPRDYAFVNLATRGVSTADALAVQLPEAQALHPTLVTVWLNVNDVLVAVQPDRYQSDLTALVHGLRSGGATVLLANTPPIERLPGYLACLAPAPHPGCPAFIPRPIRRLPDMTAAEVAYNASIAAVATREGAVLVDINSLALTGRANGSGAPLLSADGFHPSAAGAAAIAAQFDAARRGRQP